MGVLGPARRSDLEPLAQCCAAEFQVLFSSGESRNCFTMVVSYCCDILEAKNVSAVRHGAERYHPCVHCDVKYGHIEYGRRRATCTGAVAFATRRRVEELKELAARMTEKEKKRRRRKIDGKIERLQSEQSLAEWPSFPENICVDDALVVSHDGMSASTPPASCAKKGVHAIIWKNSLCNLSRLSAPEAAQ